MYKIKTPKKPKNKKLIIWSLVFSVFEIIVVFAIVIFKK
jgi:hypothetical protein